jgi:hypothetical protein
MCPVSRLLPALLLGSACSSTKPADSGPSGEDGGVGGDAGTDGGTGADGGTGTGTDGGTPIVQPGDWTVSELVVNHDDCAISDAFGADLLSFTAVSESGWDLEVDLPDAPLRLRCAWDGTYWSAGPADDTLPGGTVRTAEIWGARDGENTVFGSLFFDAACPGGSCGDETPAPCSSELDFTLVHTGE